jgi:hypothetical protein
MPSVPTIVRRTRWWCHRGSVVLLLVVLVVVPPTTAAIADAGAAGVDTVDYRPPVDGPIIEPFGHPEHPYAPGKRGVGYRTEAGEPVLAAADGTVLFAGAVAGSLHVTVGHADGLRTSYSFLAEVGVAAGRSIRQGEAVGTSVGFVHFGVRRADETYLDPEEVLAGHGPRVRLVAAPAPTPAGVRVEGLALLGTALDALAGGRAASAAHYAVGLRPEMRLRRVGEELARRRRDRRTCTDASVAPPLPEQRRIVVLVAGIGSTSEVAAVDDVDTGALGYRPHDVIRFSYRGGRTPAGPAGGELADIAAHRYDVADTQDDLVAAGGRLRRLLSDIALRAPGVPVDVIGHSQGGVVARLALTDLVDGPALAPEVDLVATIASPHRGAGVATAVTVVSGEPRGARALDWLGGQLGVDLDPAGVSVRQLAETSPLQGLLSSTSPPDGVRLLTIAARGDLVVPSPHTVFWEAPRAVVGLSGPAAHGDLPGHGATTTELALAVGGLAPRCVSTATILGDVATGEGFAWAQDTLGALSWVMSMP